MQVFQKPSETLSLGLQQQLDFLLTAALNVTGDMGNLQLVDPATGSLKIVSQSGFDTRFLDFFNATPEGRAACGTALLRRRRIVVENVAADPIFAGTRSRRIVLDAGARAVHSTPILNAVGDPLGVLSCHYFKPTRPSGPCLRAIARLAQHAAAAIECFRPGAARFHAQSVSPEPVPAYSIFHRAGNAAQFLECSAIRHEAIERLRMLSLEDSGEFVLFDRLNVIAVGTNGFIHFRNGARRL